MLLKHIERVKPKAVCFGHIHENAGQIVSEQGVRYINASSLNRRYKLYKNPITEIEI
jgi:Icc-related predicted phosphoesterase